MLLLSSAVLADPLLVTTDLGVVRGAEGPGVRAFKGIPFAEAPTGERRFAPPVPAGPWRGILDAPSTEARVRSWRATVLPMRATMRTACI